MTICPSEFLIYRYTEAGRHYLQCGACWFEAETTFPPRRADAPDTHEVVPEPDKGMNSGTS